VAVVGGIAKVLVTDHADYEGPVLWNRIRFCIDPDPHQIKIRIRIRIKGNPDPHKPFCVIKLIFYKI
jgi:hypothetical protein